MIADGSELRSHHVANLDSQPIAASFLFVRASFSCDRAKRSTFLADGV